MFVAPDPNAQPSSFRSGMKCYPRAISRNYAIPSVSCEQNEGFDDYHEITFSLKSRRKRKKILLADSIQQLENRVGTDRDVVADNAFFVDEIGDGCGEHGVAARDFPLLLQHYGEGQSMLFDLRAVFFRLAPADQHDRNLGICLMKLPQLWHQRIAWAALGAGKDQQNALTAEVC